VRVVSGRIDWDAELGARDERWAAYEDVGALLPLYLTPDEAVAAHARLEREVGRDLYVFPSWLRSRDGKILKKPADGCMWDAMRARGRADVRDLWQSFGQRGHALVEGRAMLAIHCGASRLVVFDTDSVPVSVEWLALLTSPTVGHVRRSLSGKPHFYFADDADQVSLPGTWAHGDVKRGVGFVVVSGHEPISTARATRLPLAITRSLGRGLGAPPSDRAHGYVRGVSVSEREMRAWLSAHDREDGRSARLLQTGALHTYRREWRERGVAKNTALNNAVMRAATDVAAGLYAGGTAYNALLDEYRADVEADGDWHDDREPQYVRQWCGAIALCEGNPATIAAVRDRAESFGTSDDELFSAWLARVRNARR
jgi:hypothetical protein